MQMNLQLFAKKPRVKRNLTTKELAALSHAINTELLPSQKERGILEKAFGGYVYIINLGENGDYEVLGKKAIDETSKYYDKEFSRWKDGTRSKTVRVSGKKTK